MIERRFAVGLMVLLAACARQEPVGDEIEALEVNVPVPEVPRPVIAAGSREPLAYTSLKAQECRLIEENAAEAGYTLHSCPGLAGYALETSESDLRQDLAVVAPDGKRSELGLSSLVAKGAFNALGERAEWRGADATKPSALIIRLGVAEQPDKPDTSNLVVVKLADPVCVVAVIPPGPEQNSAGRDKADSSQGSCITD